MNKISGPKECYSLLREDDSRYIVSYKYQENPNEENSTWYETYIYKRKKSMNGFNDVKKAIVDDINASTDEKILTGFIWNEKPVYLSSENQFNFKAAYDLAVQTQGQTLPVTFKLGEKDGEPVYYEFTNMVEFTDFYVQAISFINNCLKEGWREKDSIDFEPYKEFFEEKEKPQEESLEES